MKRQIKLGLLAVALTALLTGLALPGLAQAGVSVNVGAIQKDDGSIVVSVLAISSTRVGAATLDAWDLTSLVVSDGADLLALATEIEDHSFPLLRAKLWVVKISSGADLTPNSDTVTAVVDIGATDVTDTAPCGPGLPRLHITAICK
jgi:hypothetical protein